MTSLEQIICHQIRETGPLTVADYMTLCLLHPEFGYYTTHDPFGSEGDFITAPEITQMFGELLGFALAQSWVDRGSPDFNLVELGPGRGTLMADLLRATAIVPGFHQAMSLHLIEASPKLRDLQRQTIGQSLTHHDHLTDIPSGKPVFLVANEFFDALPIRQFQREADHWRERLIGLEKGRLSFGLSDPTKPETLQTRLTDTRGGDIVETSAPSNSLASEIGHLIDQNGGVAVIIDYGDWRSLGDTLQAIQHHQPVDLLSDPGSADLTAHVDFEALAMAAAPARHSRVTPQGVLLERLGITARAQKLASNLSGAALESHIAAHRRLTHPDEMGTLFKAMAICQKDTPLPPGFVE